MFRCPCCGDKLLTDLINGLECFKCVSCDFWRILTEKDRVILTGRF